MLELTGSNLNLYGDIAFIDSTVSFQNTTVSFDSSLPTTTITLLRKLGPLTHEEQLQK